MTTTTIIIIIEIEHPRIVDGKQEIVQIGPIERRNVAMTLLKRALHSLKKPSNLGKKIITSRVILGLLRRSMSSERGSIKPHSDSDTLSISALRTGGSSTECNLTTALGALRYDDARRGRWAARRRRIGRGRVRRRGRECGLLLLLLLLLLMDGVRVATKEELARLARQCPVVVA